MLVFAMRKVVYDRNWNKAPVGAEEDADSKIAAPVHPDDDFEEAQI